MTDKGPPGMPVLDDFIGAWGLERRIEDRRAAVDGRFLGHAILTACATGAAYHEEGTLAFGDAPPMAASRDYLWQGREGRIAVDFADGRPFHDFDARTPRPTAHHDCPPDIYHVSYDFEAWPDWTSRWIVRGPAKDYTMISRYTRR